MEADGRPAQQNPGLGRVRRHRLAVAASAGASGVASAGWSAGSRMASMMTTIDANERVVLTVDHEGGHPQLRKRRAAVARRGNRSPLALHVRRSAGRAIRSTTLTFCLPIRQ